MEKNLTTEQLASVFKVKAPSIRSAYCKEGHYQGIRPRKLPNRRLVWPAAEVARVVGEEVA